MPQSDIQFLPGFILLILISAATSYFASRKGRSPTIWFILGLLFGPFAPLVLLLLPSVKSGEDGMPSMTMLPPDPSSERGSLQNLDSKSLNDEENKLWYYLDQNHEQVGPVSIIALRDLWNRGLLEMNQYVWSDGMVNWEKIANLPDLQASLNRAV